MRNLVFIICFFVGSAHGASPLLPVKTDSPRATMQSFMEAMNDYKQGVEENNEAKENRIYDAIRTLNLDAITHTDKMEFGKRTAIYLKETMDRVIVINYDLIPSDESLEGLKKWRLKDTEIRIQRISEGEREGEYLFSKDTILRAKNFFHKVKNLPYLEESGQGAGFKTPWYERQMPPWVSETTFYIPNWQILGVLIFLLLGFAVKEITRLLLHQLQRLTDKSKNTWDDQIIAATEMSAGHVAKTLFWILGIRLLNFEGNAFLLFDMFLKLLVSYHLIKLAYQLVDVLSAYLETKAKKTEFPLDDQLIPMIRKSLRLFTVIFGILIAIQNLGVNVMSVLAGLGLGGLAFALAAKDTCANLFGSIMILMDKPFRVGDWITVNGVDGTVEEIGFRSTKVRTFHSSLVSIPNSVLANTNIDNMGRRKHRRVKAMLGLTYSTSSQQMETFLEGVKEIVLANPYTVKDNFHVVFHSYGDFSLNVLLYCFLDVKDWAQEMVERQNLYLAILNLADEVGVEFAFPTQSLFVHQEESPSTTSRDTDYKALAKSFKSKFQSSGVQGEGIFIPPFKQ